MKKIAFWILTLIIIPNSIKAYECSNTDKERLQKLANNVSVSYEEYENNLYFLNVIFSGVSNEITISNDQRHEYLIYANLNNSYFGEVKSYGLDSGKNYTFSIYGTKKCIFQKLRTITIQIPSYNIYYKDNVCQNAREYYLCQKWMTANLSYEEFTKKVNDYISIRDNKKENNNDNSNEMKQFDFFQFYEKYYVPTFIMMIFILIILILLWIKENKKNNLK